MALQIVEALMKRHQVVCLHPADGQAWQQEGLDADIMTGELTSPVALKAAGIANVDVFVACSKNDEQNIVACMAARRLGAQKTICVLLRKGILSTHAEGLELAQSLGIDQIVRPIDQLAQELLSIILVPGALEAAQVAEGRISLFRYKVDAGSQAAHSTLAALKLPKKTRLVHLRRAEEFIVPRGDTQLLPGDRVIAMGDHQHLTRLGELMTETSHQRREAVVVGGGRVGRAVTRGLMRAGFGVKVIESSRERCDIVAEKTEALVLHGDGTDLEFLEQEHIGEAPVVIAVTNSDERNLLVSLVVKQLGSARVLTRAARLSNERLFEKVGVDVVRSAKGAALRTIVATIDPKGSEIHAELEHGDARVLEISVADSAKPLALAAASPPSYSVVGAILRGIKVIFPGGSDEIRPGDHLFVFCAREDEESTRDYFENPSLALAADL